MHEYAASIGTARSDLGFHFADASEQRDLAIAEVVSSASHARTVLSAMLSNVVARVPDAPTEASRNIARMGNMVTD